MKLFINNYYLFKGSIKYINILAYSNFFIFIKRMFIIFLLFNNIVCYIKINFKGSIIFFNYCVYLIYFLYRLYIYIFKFN